MKIIIASQLLNQAVATVARALGNKPNTPALEGILVETCADGVFFHATDTSLGISVKTEAIVEMPGQLLVQGRLFAEITRKLAVGDACLAQTGTAASLTCNEACFSLATLDAESFPKIEETPKTAPVLFSSKTLRDKLSRTLFAASSDESRGALTGCLFEKQGKTLTLVTLDGARMAMVYEALDGDEFSVVLPAKGLSELQKLLPDEGQVSMWIQGSLASFSVGDTLVQTRLVAGDYARYQGLIPSSYTTRVEMQADVLRDCVDRVAVLSREASNHLIVMSIEEQRMVLSSKSQIGTAREEVPVLHEGENLEVCFNAKLMGDVLRVIDTPSVVMTMTTPLAACTLAPATDAGWKYVVMPVRIS